jgi:hypothetical protein
MSLIFYFCFLFVFKDLLFDTALLLLLIKKFMEKKHSSQKKINTHKHILYL